MKRLINLAVFLLCCMLFSFCQVGEENEPVPVDPSEQASPSDEFTIEQSLSDQAQLNTIAFDALAFITGDLCSDTFFPPGKVADFFGFQYLRDNDSDKMGHNTDFLSRAADNVLYILTDSQLQLLINLANEQVGQINQYAYKRFPLMKAFRRQLSGDIPAGSSGLDMEVVRSYSAEIYRIDGEMSYRRAIVIGEIINSLDINQRAHLDQMTQSGMNSWPLVTPSINPRDFPRDIHVAIMTFASQLFSWYKGNVDADVYFCPERHGTYFGSFYLKDIPAMGNQNYTIDENLTGEKGKQFLKLLTETQADWINGLVENQRSSLHAIVDRRREISMELRKCLNGATIDREKVLALVEAYGQLDGEIVYRYATRFAQVFQTLSDQQKSDLMALRDLDNYPCSGAYLYSENIDMIDIGDTDFFFK